MYLDGFPCWTRGSCQSPTTWATVMSRGHCPDASGLRWAVPGAAIGFGRPDLAIGNGAGCGIPPVGSNAAVDIPVIVLFPAFLPLRASNCNGWARAWVSGQGCERGRGRRCIRFAVSMSLLLWPLLRSAGAVSHPCGRQGGGAVRVALAMPPMGASLDADDPANRIIQVSVRFEKGIR